jgi:hypothetical protein
MAKTLSPQAMMCGRCGDLRATRPGGRCETCDKYLRRNGQERPLAKIEAARERRAKKLTATQLRDDAATIARVFNVVYPRQRHDELAARYRLSATPDGYARSSAGFGGPGRSNGVSTPTEDDARARIEGRQDDDPQGRALDHIATEMEVINEANRILVENDELKQVLQVVLQDRGVPDTDGFLEEVVGVLLDAGVDLRPLIDAVVRAAKAARNIEQESAYINFVTKQRPSKTPATVALCLACATNEPDPRRAGYCKPCYSKFDDYGRPDRAAFEAWMRGDRADPPPPQGKAARRGPYRAELSLEKSDLVTC